VKRAHMQRRPKALRLAARCGRSPFSTLAKALYIASSRANHVLQGGKNRRRGKNENDNEKRELVFKEEGQEYAQVVKMLGNGRLEAQCFDGARRLAHIRGKLRKKVWINQGDIILLSLRDYQDEKGDVIMKYSGALFLTTHLKIIPRITVLTICSRRGPFIKSLRRAP
jgi:initiation factor 1A